MEFFQPYIDMWKNFANFQGRTSLRGFWMAFLVNIIASFVVGLLAAIPYIGPIILTLYNLAVIIPGLSLAVRRLHDIGKSGWMLLISLIPLVGAIILIIWYCKGSEPDNQYGPTPMA